MNMKCKKRTMYSVLGMGGGFLMGKETSLYNISVILGQIRR